MKECYEILLYNRFRYLPNRVGLYTAIYKLQPVGNVTNDRYEQSSLL